jgi:hypothetical protein
MSDIHRPPQSISTDQLFIASSALSQARDRREEARDGLLRIAGSAEYQAWHSGGTMELRPFAPPNGLGTGVLEELGLVREGQLGVKINLVGDSLMLTDGVWVNSDIRVFPFSDESEAISKYCCRRSLLERTDLVIDLATGNGHNLAWFRRDVRSVGMDINPRALSYFHFNNVINGIGNRVGVLNDIRCGISNIVDGADTPNILILGNLPFGLAPTARTLPATSNGGETGLDLQRAALAAVAVFMRTKFGTRSRAVLLGYSVGSSTEDRWQVLDLARAMLPEHELGFSILKDEGLTRVDGRRVLANPSPVRAALHAAGSCRLYHQNTKQAQALYASLSDRLVARGWSDLAYGVLEIGPVERGLEASRPSVDS